MKEVSPDQISLRSLVTPVKLLACCLWITLLTACDPVSQPIYTVDRLGFSNNNLYARISVQNSFGVGMEVKEEQLVFESSDRGKNWGMIAAVPQELKQIWAVPVQYPKIVCRKAASIDCYQISGREQIDISMDAGASWKRSWKFPVGRKEFLNRNPRLALLSPDPPHAKLEPDTVPKDIVIRDLPDGYVVIAALGNQGILIQNNGGKWERQYLYKALPLPYTLTKIEEIDDYLLNELFLSGCISAILLIIITAYFVFTRKKLLPWITPVILFIFLLVPFILWAYGIVPLYEVVLAGAVILSGVLIVRSYISLRSKERANKAD